MDSLFKFEIHSGCKPWEFLQLISYASSIKFKEPEKAAVAIVKYNPNGPTPDQERIARLITAAPQLYEVMASVSVMMRYGPRWFLDEGQFWRKLSHRVMQVLAEVDQDQSP